MKGNHNHYIKNRIADFSKPGESEI